MQLIPEVRLGHALVSLVTPHAGEAAAFNRWYERDHFFAGCMIGANFFSGRRWVATRSLRELAGPVSSPLYREYCDGSLLVLYWLLDGAYDQALDWAVDQVNQLYRQDRMDPRRDNVYSGFCDAVFNVARHADGVPVELALEHPYRGVWMAIVDKDDTIDEAAFIAECRDTLLPAWLQRSGVDLMVGFKPKPLPEAAPKTVKQVDRRELDNRYLWFGFVSEAPADATVEHWRELGEHLRTGQMGELLFYAPFIPTIPGTDTYMDLL